MRLKDSNIVKIAVEYPDHMPQLIEFNQKQPLATIIQDLCNNWEISQPDQYALQFCVNDRQNYVTEKNRNDIKNGDVFILTYSACRTAQDILSTLNTGTNEERILVLQRLPKLSGDKTFAYEFINKQGLSLLISIIEQKKFQDTMIANCLQSFVELMDHRIVSWDTLESPFIITIAGYVNNHSKSQEPEIIQAALVILESIVLNSTTGKGAQVEKEITFPNLVVRLEYPNAMVQQNALALINALLTKADYTKRKAVAATLWSKQVRHVLLTKIIESDQIRVEMAYQLYVLQTSFLGLLEQRMNTKMDPQDQDSLDKIKELKKIAFEMDPSSDTVLPRNKNTVLSKDFKKLGFKLDYNPALDFDEVPPGLLALDCMNYFAKHHVEAYTKVVLENSCRADEHECPFVRASIELVKLLCQILRIGEPPEEHKNPMYYPMFFTHDHPFEELYCTTIIILNKTWKEMRATIEDFTKVFSVVREQISRALESQPMNFEKLRLKLQTLTYSEITNLWQQERTSREEWESHAKPIVQLKELIMPEILDLIQKQRLGYLVAGTRFTKYPQRGSRAKDKFWYVRLSLNHKIFHYGDCDEKSTPTVEELPSKLQIADIKALVTGKDCPHIKEARGRKTNHHLAFSLTLDSIEVSSLDFIAPDEETFHYWTDGINALLGLKMTSKEAEKDLETLLSMEIKLRLLDAEGINIPQDPPTIPPDPSNYDFALDFK